VNLKSVIMVEDTVTWTKKWQDYGKSISGNQSFILMLARH
jgi:hypothetical protein